MIRRTPLKRSQKPLRRTPLKKVSDKKLEEMKDEKEERRRMNEWFKMIWDERQDDNGYCYCFETGKPMHRSVYRGLSACYDHVLEKQDNQFPQYKFTKKNIVIILPSVHAQKGMNIDYCPKLKEYRDELLKLHNENKLNDGRDI